MSFIIESSRREYPSVRIDENYINSRKTIEKRMIRDYRREYCKKTLLDIVTMKISPYEYEEYGFPGRKLNIDDFIEVMAHIDDYSDETRKNIRDIIERSVLDHEYHEKLGKNIGKLLIKFDECKDVYDFIIHYLRMASRSKSPVSLQMEENRNLYQNQENQYESDQDESDGY